MFSFQSKVLPLFFFVLAAASLTPSYAAVIGFDGQDDNDFDPGETYSEDGFVFEVISGDCWGLYASGGNPPSALVSGLGCVNGAGDTVKVTAADAGLFAFDSVDIAGFSVLGGATDTVDIIGLVNSVQTESLLGVSAVGTAFSTINASFASPVDELRIVAVSGDSSALALDNFVVSRVPAPATVLLMVIGAAGFGFLRKHAVS